MDRNKLQTAIHCLEVALHPNTGDDEVIAGVNGFRRTAGNTPLSEVCAEFAARPATGPDNDNLELHRRLERERLNQAAALRRLHEAERLIRELSEGIRAEQQSFAAFRAASAEIVDSLRHENVDLRGALASASRAASPAASRFHEILAAAMGEAAAPLHPASAVARPRHPWTA